MKKTKMTFWVGDKKLNDIWKGLDLGSEGVYCEEVYTMTFKNGFNSSIKKKIIDGIIKVYKKGGKEVRDFKFEVEI